MDEPELDVEGLDELLDLCGDRRTVLLEFRCRGHEYRVSERDVLRDVEKLDLALVNPRLDGEFPTVEVRFHQHRELVVGDGVDLVGRANDAVPKAAGLVEGLEVDGVVGVAVELEQRLIDAPQEPDDVLAVVGFFEDADTDTAELRASLHQRLVAQEHGLTEQPRVTEQHRVDCAGPLHRLLVQRDRDVDALVLQRLGDLE